MVSPPVVALFTLADPVKDLGEPYHRVVGLGLPFIQ